MSLLSGNFTGYLEIFKIIPKHPRPSGHFLDNPETFQLIWKLSRPYGNFPVQFQWLRAKTFRTRKNFPDGNATMPRWFLCLWNVDSLNIISFFALNKTKQNILYGDLKKVFIRPKMRPPFPICLPCEDELYVFVKSTRN